MIDDIFAGIEPVDSSVVRFGAWLLQESKQFNSFMLTPTVEGVFGKKKPEQAFKFHVEVKEYNVNVNRGGEILPLKKGVSYPVGVPSSLGDFVLTEKEADFLKKRGMCGVVA